MNVLIAVLILIVLTFSWFINHNYLFMLLLLALYVSQLFILVPGSDASSASYGSYNTISFYGMTFSAWISILLILFCLISILFFRSTDYRLRKIDLFCIYSLSLFLVVGIIMSNNLVDSADTFMKLLMPFFIYYYARFCIPSNQIGNFYKLFLLINIIMIGQVVICKILTGSFAANSYYRYAISEEYFGYYYSPHPFSALLGLLSFWSIKCINERKLVIVNSFLLFSNLLLIFLSGVRTYALGIAIAIFLLMISTIFDKKLRNIRKLAFFMLIIALALILIIPNFISLSRLSNSFLLSDISSGRLDRWAIDYHYFINPKSLINLLFGNGFNSIYEINQSLIGVNINSLNVFLDLLVENGVLGMFLFILSYILVWKECYKKGHISNTIMIAMTLFIIFGLLINNLLPYVTIMPLFILFLAIFDLEFKKEKGNLNNNENFSITSSSISHNS